MAVKKLGDECEICGEYFDYAETGRFKYCSDTCAAKAHNLKKRREVTATCEYCGKQFKPGTAGKRARFCPQPAPCRALWRAANPQTFTHTCKDCKVSYTSQSAKGDYCPECRKNHGGNRKTIRKNIVRTLDKVIQEDGSIDPYYLQRGLK